MQLRKARQIAEDLVSRLAPHCHRIQIAGSVRREKAEIGDLDIVCVPHLVEIKDMFGDTMANVSALADVDWSRFGRLLKNGSKYKRLALPEGICADLHIVWPKAWGYQMAIRTGPPEYSHWLVTKKRYGGALPAFVLARDGLIRHADTHQVIPVYEEPEFFELLGLLWVDPNIRKPPESWAVDTDKARGR